MIALICGTGSFPKEIFKILNKKKNKIYHYQFN